MMEEKRQSERRTYEHNFDFSVSVVELYELKRLELKGMGINISNEGLCIQTEYPLKPGHVLRFNNGIGHKAGIVKWNKKIENRYRIGIKFI